MSCTDCDRIRALMVGPSPGKVYGDALAFLESIAELPPHVQMRMVRSYLKHLSEPDLEVDHYRIRESAA